MLKLLNAGLKSFPVFAAIMVCSAFMSSVACAQDDPNAQYILIQSGELAAQVREVEVPVEVGVWKLQFNLQSTGDVNWTMMATVLSRPKRRMSARPIPMRRPRER